MKRLALLSLPATAAIWMIFAWPLPRYVGSGIPSSAENSEKCPARFMILGDHLQLLYNFWLVQEMVTGRIPWFHDVYEFNMGDDAARGKSSAYLLPFSAVHAAVAPLGGQALGYNVTLFGSLWATFLLTALLARRFTKSAGAMWVAAVVGVAFPYRWFTLFGGSPTGLAMTWLPAFFLGIDLVIRDYRAAGGVITGAALLGLSASDSHSIFFGPLAAPMWALFCLLNADRIAWLEWRTWRRWLVAALPAAALSSLTLLHNVGRASRIAAGGKSEGHSWLETEIYSPHVKGLFHLSANGTSASIYLGWAAVVVAGAGLVVCLFKLPRRRPHKRFLEDPSVRGLLRLAFLCALACGLVLLVLGAHGPHHGVLLRTVRHYFPPYAMLRQPQKVFLLMPTILAMASALSVEFVIRLGVSRWWRAVVPAAAALALLVSWSRRVHTSVCLLDKEEPAYAAVARDAASAPSPPRAMAVPLWPGDSADSTLCLYDASLYRIRMLNGYSAVTHLDYKRDVYSRFRSVNLGVLDDGQIQDLEGMGIHHLLLHENAFPEKVSPFPVGVTLQRLLRHPRLELLCQHESVWAFRFRPPATSPSAPPAGAAPAWPWYFPARQWDVATFCKGGALIRTDADGGRYAVFAQPKASYRASVGMTAPEPDLRWMVRAQGRGTLSAVSTVAGEAAPPLRLPLHAERWQWVPIPIAMPAMPASAQLLLTAEDGTLDLDRVALTAGPWPPLEAGQSRTLPAPCFFHAGYTDLAAGCVRLRAGRDPADVIFYGPELPLDAGSYSAEVDFATAAPRGTEVARFGVRRDDDSRKDWVAMRAGERAVLRFARSDNRPVCLGICFAGAADMEIRAVALTRPGPGLTASAVPRYDTVCLESP